MNPCRKWETDNRLKTQGKFVCSSFICIENILSNSIKNSVRLELFDNKFEYTDGCRLTSLNIQMAVEERQPALS